MNDLITPANVAILLGGLSTIIAAISYAIHQYFDIKRLRTQTVQTSVQAQADDTAAENVQMGALIELVSQQTVLAGEYARQNAQVAAVLAQTATLLTRLSTGQIDIGAAISQADRRSSTQVRSAQRNILEAIEKVQVLITEALDMLAKQEDQPDAIARLERAIAALQVRQAAEDTTVESEAA